MINGDKIKYSESQNFEVQQVGVVIYLQIEGTLYAQKVCPVGFLAIFDSKFDQLNAQIKKKCEFCDKIQLVMVKYYEV